MHVQAQRVPTPTEDRTEVFEDSKPSGTETEVFDRRLVPLPFLSHLPIPVVDLLLLGPSHVLRRPVPLYDGDGDS